MKRPSLAALFSAVALYALFTALGRVMIVVVPLLVGLYREHPRLAVLAGLGCWMSPMLVIALLHRLAHKGLDRLDAAKARGVLPSLWSGFIAWAVMLGATSIRAFVVLAVFPPDLPGESLAAALWGVAFPMNDALVAALDATVWIVAAASLYELRRRVERAEA